VKSLVEKMKYLLALRTTLIVSKVMAAIRNAKDQKVIELELNENDLNVEQTLDVVKNMYIKKHSPKFYNDPEMVARNIVANSLSIIPRNMPGTKNTMTVSTEHRDPGIRMPDDELLTSLTNMTSLGYGVPPSALNQLNETEYARSVATNNLFFSNKIRCIQREIKKYNNKFGRNYVKYSSYIFTKIKGILEKGDVKNIDDTMKKVVYSIEIDLASPSVSTSKAQFEELRAYLEMIETVMEKLFSPDLLSTPDPQTKDLLNTLRAQIKAELIRDFVSVLGLQEIIKVPTIEEVNVKDIHNIQQFVLNLKKGLDDFAKALIKTPESGGGGGF